MSAGRLLLVLVSAVAAILLSPSAPALAASCGEPPEGTCQFRDCDIDIGGCAPAGPNPGGGGGGPSNPHPPRYTYVPTCPGNNFETGGAVCAAALTGCPEEGDIQFWVYVETWIDAVGAYGPPVRQAGVSCFGADQPGLDPRIAVIAQVRRDWKSYPIPGATVATQPADGTLAGAVTRFASDRPTRFALAPQTILGFQVTVTVTAAEYTWIFGDGTTAQSPPTATPTAEHVYRTAGPMAVSLRASYTGTFTIGGSPEVYDLEGTAEVPGQQRLLPVEQARTQLEAGTPR